MKLIQAAHDLHQLVDAVDDFTIKRESLEYCLGVYRQYASGETPANQWMDRDQALEQLLHAVERMLSV